MPTSDRVVLTDEEYRLKMAMVMGVSPVAVREDVVSLRCAKCGADLLDPANYGHACMHVRLRHGGQEVSPRHSEDQ